MTIPISPVSPGLGIEKLKPATSGAGAPGDFMKALDESMQSIQALNRDASGSVEKFLKGDNDELHNTALAAQRAEIAFELGLQVRNKVVQAYQEIMRMQM
jgi:flagellar hook-basal body complex protein FliE